LNGIKRPGCWLFLNIPLTQGGGYPVQAGAGLLCHRLQFWMDYNPKHGDRVNQGDFDQIFTNLGNRYVTGEKQPTSGAMERAL
jgi:hypothetical protein